MGCLLCLRKYRIQNDETLESIGRVRHQLGLTEITPDNQLPDSNRVINVVGLLSRY
jgi:pyruvate/oxaloacetate carboxyltransferase